LITNNYVHHNARGIRVNATNDLSDPYDGLSSNHRIESNRIEDSSEHRIYFYARTDRNLIIGNTILRSGVNGVYIKSGGNRLENNSISHGVTGVTISGGEYLNDPPQALDALDPPGNNNVIISTTVTANSGVGIRIMGGSSNRIGPTQVNELGNRVENNGIDGIAISDAANGAVSTDNQVLKNTIRNNLRHGILVKDVSSIRNRISQNSITSKGQRGIRIDSGAQVGIQPPVIAGKSIDNLLGTANANATVEIYTDPGTATQRVLDTVTTLTTDAPIVAAARPDALAYVYAADDLEGKTFLGSAVADGAGNWTFPLQLNVAVKQLTAGAIDQSGNTSAFTQELALLWIRCLMTTVRPRFK
jgi:parallel beta-helix repeat protein